jgi:hypothetical protein
LLRKKLSDPIKARRRNFFELFFSAEQQLLPEHKSARSVCWREFKVKFPSHPSHLPSFLISHLVKKHNFSLSAYSEARGSSCLVTHGENEKKQKAKTNMLGWGWRKSSRG